LAVSASLWAVGDGGLAIEAAREAAEALPGDGWLGRVNEGVPSGPAERMLAAVRATVYARDEGQAESGYGLETEYANLDAPLIEAIADLMKALEALVKPLMVLGQRLEALVEEAPDWLDSAARARIEGAMASLSWRVDTLRGWIALLGRGGGPADPDFVRLVGGRSRRGPRI